MKKFNDFIGNCYILVGSLKSILAILLIIQLIGVLLGGGLISDYSTYSGLVGLCELILIPISIIMIVVNLAKAGGKQNSGYVLGLLAIGLEFLFSGFILVFLVFFQCVMFLKAGTLIKTSGLEEKEIKNIKNTEWFYEEK